MNAKHKKYVIESPVRGSVRMPVPAKKYISLLAAAAIIFLGFIIYANSLHGKFIWDDEFLIKNNAHIKQWAYLPKIFTENLGAGAGREYNFYRPIQTLTYMIEYSLGGSKVETYHFSNILLHIAAALCVCWFINILFSNWLLSFLTGILFLTHPVHTEAVAYISGRSDPLSLVFMLLSFIFYIKYLEKDNIAALVVTIIAYVSALLSREASLIFPVLVGLYHYTFKKKVKARAFLPVLCVALFYIALRLSVLRFAVEDKQASTSLFQRLPGFFAAIANYIRLLLLPSDLHMEYGVKLFHFLDPWALAGIAASIFLLIYAFRQRADNKPMFFSILWFFITLLPVSNLYPINAYMAEHWLYMPSLGFFLIIARGLSSLFEKKNFVILAILLTTGLLGFYSYVTIKQNNYWREPIAFYENTLKYSSGSARIYTNLCSEYNDIGKHKEAIAAGRKAVAIDPDDGDSYNNLGLAYKDNSEYEEAIAAFKKAVELKPKDGGIYFNLGAVYKSIKRFEEAIEAYKRYISIRPDDCYAYDNLGNCYFSLGSSEEAMAAYNKAIQINPNDAYGYNNIGTVYKGLKKNKEAIDAYKRSIECDPHFVMPYKNLARVYYQEKQYDAAVKYYDDAVRLGGEFDEEFSAFINSHRESVRAL